MEQWCLGVEQEIIRRRPNLPLVVIRETSFAWAERYLAGQSMADAAEDFLNFNNDHILETL